jgi:dihydrofolate synthase / folylpolyglutamate synthase
MACQTYEQAIEYLFGRINYERSQVDSYSTSDFKLDRMHDLLNRLGRPQSRLPAVHVAGTKGKGSTCTLLASVLTSAGYRTGLYTSPHLVRFEERMQVDRRLPSPELLVELVNRVAPAVAEMDRLPALWHPTYFEIATAMAWLCFLDQQCQWAVLETGLGGRLDSTNVCSPQVTCITNVSRDHMQLLGSTVREIAGEKAGIIKPGVPVISGAMHPDAAEVMARTATERGSPLWQLGKELTWRWSTSSTDPVADSSINRSVVVDTNPRANADGSDSASTVAWQRRPLTIDVSTPRHTWTQIPVVLRGEHQAANTALVVGMVDWLVEQGVAISPEQLRLGLTAAEWPARIELVGQRPAVVIDAAHNWASAKALVSTLQAEFTARRRILVFATTKDKDYRGLLRQLVPHFDSLIFTRYRDNPRGVSIDELSRYTDAVWQRPSHAVADPVQAWRLARRLAAPDDLIVVTGSFFLVGELRDLIREDCRSTVATAAHGSELASPASPASPSHATSPSVLH